MALGVLEGILRRKNKVCINGHDTESVGLYVRKSGITECGECRRASQRRFYEKRKLRIKEFKDKTRFGGNREKAIQRDNEMCITCGMTRMKHKDSFKRDITVDHIDGNGRGKRMGEQNNSLDNLATLCLPCHGKKDYLRYAGGLS